MTEYVTLLGTDEVQRAGRNMQSAAEQMQRAAASIEESNRLFLMRFEELVSRLENALAAPVERLDLPRELDDCG